MNKTICLFCKYFEIKNIYRGKGACGNMYMPPALASTGCFPFSSGTITYTNLNYNNNKGFDDTCNSFKEERRIALLAKR